MYQMWSVVALESKSVTAHHHFMTPKNQKAEGLNKSRIVVVTLQGH
jgi:hypothetical protein